jgi:tetratricopeptide (TPR) repeat protein
MRKRLVIGSVGALLLLVVGAAAALYFGNRREVTTSSDAAYRVYRDAMENERRFYFKEAREGFAKALELDPQFAEAMLGLARRTDSDQGLALVKRAAKERDRLTERERLHVDLQLAGRERKMDEVLRVSRIIHEKYPDDIGAAMVLAAHEIETGNTEKALQIFSELLAVEPNNAQAYNSIGYFYAYRGEYDKAIENIKKYQFMAPDQANPYDSLGEIQAYSGHYDEAIANLNQALKLKPDFFNSYLNLGVAYEGKGDYAKAIEYFRKGAKEAMNDDLRRNHLRQALRAAYVARDVAAAKELVSQFEALPGDKHAELTRLVMDAVLDLMEGRPAEAEKRLREAQPKLEAAYREESGDKSKESAAFQDPGVTFLLAQSLVRQGRDDEAIPLFEQLAGSPKPYAGFEARRWVFAARALLAEIVARRGDLDRAEKLLAENRKWNPSWAPTRSSEQVVAQLRREKVLAASQ